MYKEWTWSREEFDRSNDISKDCLLKLELPLLDNTTSSLGTLWMVKDLRRDSVSHYTLRRVEHLRRSVVETLKKLANKENG
jgi:UDP-GlcNAc:undecaprenyl-phosphate GlcNAc-1-phosphate transferase